MNTGLKNIFANLLDVFKRFIFRFWTLLLFRNLFKFLINFLLYILFKCNDEI